MSPTSLPSSPSSQAEAAQPWYRGVTSYQWLVLVIASLGWVFDAFEGQLYNITRGEMLPDLLRHADPTLSAEAVSTLTKAWGERFLGIFLIGGTLGGWILSSLAGSYARLLCLLPIFGFFAQGIHARYAVYFPELFPTHLRATGAGFCFNTGRILAAPVLIWLSA